MKSWEKRDKKTWDNYTFVSKLSTHSSFLFPLTFRSNTSSHKGLSQGHGSVWPSLLGGLWIWNFPLLCKAPQSYYWFKLSQAPRQWKINAGINAVFWQLLLSIIVFYIMWNAWCDQLVHLHITTGCLEGHAKKIPVISTSSFSSGLHCCENYFLWPSKGLLDWCHDFQLAPASGDRLWSCGVVVAAAGAAPSCSKPCPSCRFTPLRVLLPLCPSGFHNIDGRKIGER